MVKGIHAQQIPADAAGLFEEVDQVTKPVGIHGGNVHDQVGHTAVIVRQDGALHGLLVHEVHVLAFEIVQTVEIICRRNEFHGLFRGFHIQDGFEQIAHAILDVLSHGVQIRRKVHASRENALLILALGFSIQLFPPFGDKVQGRLVVHHDLGGTSFPEKGVADSGIPVAIILGKGLGAGFAAVCGSLHHGCDVDAGRGDGQQANGGEYGEASTDVIRNHEGLIAFCIRQRFQGPTGFVRGGVDAGFRAFLAVLAFHVLLEQAERDGRLRGGSGFGNDIDGDFLSLDEFEQIGQIGGTDVVAREVDGRPLPFFLGQIVLEGVSQCLQCRAGAEVGAADANDHQHIGVAADLGCRRLDAREFHLVVCDGQIHPTKEIASRSGLAMQHGVRCLHLWREIRDFMLRDKSQRFFVIQTDSVHKISSLAKSRPLRDGPVSALYAFVPEWATPSGEHDSRNPPCRDRSCIFEPCATRRTSAQPVGTWPR